jgi:hypothetical protein
VSNLKLMRQVFQQANEVQNDERKKASGSGIGVYRGAMGGAITDEGIFSAKCPRLDQARLLGMEIACTADERVMFSAGFGHELYMESQFKAAGLPYVREQSVQRVINGRKWTGTPDFQILVDGEWLGVEAKSLVSNFSVHKQMSHDWPYMRHILQCAHYMTALERTKWLICIGHYFYAMADGQQYPPSIRWFEVEFIDEHLTVTGENGQKTTLDINPDKVINYLKLLTNSNDSKSLAPRPLEREVGMRTYNRCSYCPMESACNSADKGKTDFETWMNKLGTTKKKGKK